MKTLHMFNRKLSAAVFATAAALFVPFGVGVATPSTAEAAALPDFTDLVDKVGPAVVNIRTTERLKQMQPGAGGSEDEEMQEVVMSSSRCRAASAPASSFRRMVMC